MIDLQDITDIENRYVDHGEPSLQDARDALADRWTEGARDRETLLRLLFLDWYACSEPRLTGLDDEEPMGRFADLFEQLDGTATQDPEVMYVVGLMAWNFPWCIGDEQTWEHLGIGLLRRYRELPPEQRLQPEHFRGRGAYGMYFADDSLAADPDSPISDDGADGWHPWPLVRALRRAARALGLAAKALRTGRRSR